MSTNDPVASVFTIFYSWQSDLPDETNRRAIRSALRTACSTVEAENPTIRIVPDEATRDTSGSPNIPLTILEKIKYSDAFIGDITTINSSSDVHRKTPNPNVLFELGYAVAHLGWGRIVMLFNTEFGNFPSDTPFDIDRHRASPYRLSPSDANNRSARNALVSLLTEAIRLIVAQQPEKPFSALQQTPEQLRRQRDIKNIKWALSMIHLPSLSEMIMSLPKHFQHKVFHFWEAFNGVVTSPLFHIYDDDVRNTFLEVHNYWDLCLSNDKYYRHGHQTDLYIFGDPKSRWSKELDRKWKEIAANSASLNNALDRLLELVRTRFVEIDINELSRTAWNEYVDYYKDT